MLAGTDAGFYDRGGINFVEEEYKGSIRSSAAPSGT